MEKTVYFLSGLPRSGSTVLSAILNQRNDLYVTPTSPLLDILIEIQNKWYQLPSVIANPVPEQLTNIVKGVIKNAFLHRPEPIIIDKNRGWGKNMPASTVLFEKEIKVIATYRDLPSIMASWYKIMKNNSYIHQVLLVQRQVPVTRETIVNEMWEYMVKDCMETYRQLKKDASNRLLVVNYDDLVTQPKSVMEQIETFLQLPSFEYDFENIKTDFVDDDLAAWRVKDLHKVRPRLEKTSEDPKVVLGEKLYNKFVELEKQYV